MDTNDRGVPPRPEIQPGDFITVGRTPCVVALVREPGDAFGDCLDVCNPEKPASRDVQWTAEGWVFPERGDFGGYAERDEKLRPYVRRLREGPWR